MHLVIINASPRVETKSNTARIIRTFVRGYEVSGNTTEVLQRKELLLKMK